MQNTKENKMQLNKIIKNAKALVAVHPHTSSS